MVLGAIFAVVTAAFAMSAVAMVPSTRFALATVIAAGKAPVASLDNAIAAPADTSASTIVPAVNATVDWLSSLSLVGVTVSPDTKTLIGVVVSVAILGFVSC